MYYSRRISWNRGSEKSPVLQILLHTNNKKRSNKELLVVADVFRLLCICVFSNRCFLFHCLYFLFSGIRAGIFSAWGLFILLSFYLLRDNDSEYNNLQNNKHNNNIEDGGIKMVMEAVSVIMFPFSYA